MGFYELNIQSFEEEGRVHLTIKCIGHEKPDNAKLIGCGGYDDYRFRVYNLIASPFVSRMDWRVGIGKKRELYLKYVNDALERSALSDNVFMLLC